MKRALCLSILAAMAFFLVGLTPASAQRVPQPPQGKNPASVVGSEWQGSETLAEFGKLTFQFQEDQKAVMIDSHSTVKGSFSQNGASIRIEFGNCVYEGTIDGTMMSGTARFTTGASTGTTWQWNVQRQGM